MSSVPPPLPKKDAAFWEGVCVYVKAFLFLFPSMFVAGFTRTFIYPKVEQLWQDSGLLEAESRAKTIMEWVAGFMNSAVFIVLGLFMILLLLEVFWARWQNMRRYVVGALMLIVHTVILAWIAVIAVEAVIAAPVLAHKKVKALKETLAATAAPTEESSEEPTPEIER